MNQKVELVVLVADKDMDLALQEILKRHQAVGMRPVEFQVWPHPEHDPGCLRTGHEFLRPFAGRCAHALVIFDRDGCGRQGLAHETLEEQVEQRLRESGWDDRAAAICIDPELEAWLWSGSSEVASALGWHDRSAELRSWLMRQGLWTPKLPKPQDPKRAVREAIRQVQKPWSAQIHQHLASRVSFRNCADPAFGKLLLSLRRWFPPRG